MSDERTDSPAQSFFEQYQLPELPGYAKLFVGIFTALALCVVFWSVWIFYEEKGKIGEDDVPLYLSSENIDTALTPDTIRLGDVPPEVQHDLAEIAMDTQAVLAPEWDSEAAGEMRPIDSADIVRIARLAITGVDTIWTILPTQIEVDSPFRRNLGLAHTHINGQTLLYFVIGLVFLFASVPVNMKKILYWLFGLSVVAHAIGLTGQGFHGAFDDVLAVSGVALLVIITYMAFLIFIDLGKKPRV